MLKKKTIKEEDVKTGKVLKTTVRYDGRLRRVLQEDTVLVIAFGDEEVLNTPFKIPSGKELHTIITISSTMIDVVKDPPRRGPKIATD